MIRHRWEHHQVSGLRGFGGFDCSCSLASELPRKSPISCTQAPRFFCGSQSGRGLIQRRSSQIQMMGILHKGAPQGQTLFLVFGDYSNVTWRLGLGPRGHSR